MRFLVIIALMLKKIFFIVLILILGILIILLIQKNQTKQETQKTKKQSINTEKWQIYKNNQYGFEFKYPNNWTSAQYITASPRQPQIDLTTQNIDLNKNSSQSTDSTTPDIRIYFLPELSYDLNNPEANIKILDDLIVFNKWKKISQKSFNSLEITAVQTNDSNKPLILYLSSKQLWLKIEFKRITKFDQLSQEVIAFLESIKFQ